MIDDDDRMIIGDPDPHIPFVLGLVFVICFIFWII